MGHYIWGYLVVQLYAAEACWTNLTAQCVHVLTNKNLGPKQMLSAYVISGFKLYV